MEQSKQEHLSLKFLSIQQLRFALIREKTER